MGFGIKTKLKKLFPQPINTPIIIMPSSGSELKDKVVLISGGTGGIGLEIARNFLLSGAKVIITGTNERKFEKIKSEISNDKLKFIVLDYKEPSSFESKLGEIINIWGRLDIFVSSTGVHVDRDGLDFVNVTLDEYDTIMNINLKGTYFMCQTVAKYMIENKIKGHILIISSQSALEPSWSPYRLSKLGIDGITKGMAQRLLEHGIIVNAIGPGPTNTSMQKNYREGNLYTPLNPIKRFTTPEEIAQIAKILVSDLGNTIVGQTIYMSGGRGIVEIRWVESLNNRFLDRDVQQVTSVVA